MFRIRHGDSAAFEELYEKYLPVATAYAAALGGRDASVTDIVQETFTRLWDRRREYRGEAGAGTYVFAYVRNICLAERRFRKRARALSQHSFPGSAHGDVASSIPEMAAYRNEMKELLEQMLAKLSNVQQQALQLYYGEGMSLHEAAASAGCTQKCFESRLYRGLADLRRLLLHRDVS